MIVRCFCSTLGLCGKNLAQIFLFRKPSWKVWRIVFLFMFNSSYVFLKVNRRSRTTISPTIFYFVCISWGWRKPTSWITEKILTPVLKSLKSFKYTDMTYGFITIDSLQHFINSIGTLPSLTQNLTFPRCSMTPVTDTTKSLSSYSWAASDWTCWHLPRVGRKYTYT